MSESSVIVEAITWAEMTAKNQAKKLKTEPVSLYRHANNKHLLMAPRSGARHQTVHESAYLGADPCDVCDLGLDIRHFEYC